MELQAIQALMAAFEDSKVREFDLQDGDFHLYLSKNKHPKEAAKPAAPVVETTPAVTAEAPASANEEAPADTASQIKAPLVGTVYLQPKPDAPAYVQPGDRVEKGDVVCVIEAMKMMTEVKSEVAGTVKRVLVADEQLVEVDQPLFEVEE